MKRKKVMALGFVIISGLVTCQGCSSGNSNPSFAVNSSGGSFEIASSEEGRSEEESSSQTESESEATGESGTEDSSGSSFVTTLPSNQVPGDSIPFVASYFRTNEQGNAAHSYPSVIVIHSEEEWKRYYDANKGRYQFGRGMGDNPSFQEIAEGDKYNADYFADKNLVLVVVEATSGSARYEVTGISEDGEIFIGIHMPSVGTADMAQWHIVIEVSKDGPEEYTTNLPSSGTTGEIK